MDDNEVRSIIQGVLQENPIVVENLKSGKAGGGFLLGRTLMKLPQEIVLDPQHIYALILGEIGI